jgi:hypothetical protein
MNPFLFVPDDIDADWRSRARCAGLHPLFDPPIEIARTTAGTDRRAIEVDEAARIDRAVAVCRTCPATGPKGPCAKSAREHHDSGVRGGVLMVDGQPSPWPRDGAA